MPPRREYWAAQAKRRLGEIVSSHTVKYPYSFYALAKDVTDEDLKKRILAKVSSRQASTRIAKCYDIACASFLIHSL